MLRETLSQARGGLEMSAFQQLLAACEPELQAATSREQFEPLLTKLATCLLTECEIVTQRARYRIIEVEAYLHCPNHEDPFVHGAADQLTACCWYFHKQKDTFKGGTYKGLDLTFGSAEAQRKGGFIIRCLQQTDSKDFIEGPCLVVERLLRDYDEPDIATYLRHHCGWRFRKPPPSAVTSSNDGFLLVSCQHGSQDSERKAKRAKVQVFATPRVGLTLKRSTPTSLHGEYIMASYRYCTEPRLKKGRTHTVMALLATGHEARVVGALTGANATRIRALQQVLNGPAATEDLAQLTDFATMFRRLHHPHYHKDAHSSCSDEPSDTEASLNGNEAC
ncbi:uncharacterized protein MONBRDRAFT_28088 [Monosiga brevicollis MX1]|uniref:Uncharacterized protein n=1 Tax=Monosiga brevicollis TaxID=81824 RepID=A9V759_MONBE|nr:uncharacterized protein MONBRDRAFT_28088 [Monosiga brevicollis MX1]EDQ86734.1 predicted protein [Monosiga brevicollis MX1]|eukprot:XP_001748570.1 hypothetical protein [Monosiga brevicollis MX1]